MGAVPVRDSYARTQSRRAIIGTLYFYIWSLKTCTHNFENLEQNNQYDRTYHIKVRSHTNKSFLDPMYYTLYTMPYTLLPMLYAIWPITYTIYHMTYALYPIPYALNPMPYALRPLPLPIALASNVSYLGSIK